MTRFRDITSMRDAEEKRGKPFKRLRARPTKAKRPRALRLDIPVPTPPLPTPDEIASLARAQADRLPIVTVDAGPRRPGPRLDKAARLRSPSWLAMVRADPCERCGRPAPSEAAHVKVRGGRDDTFDPLAVPLCTTCHRLHHDGRLLPGELDRVLGAYLCRRLPRLTRCEARGMFEEMLAGLGG